MTTQTDILYQCDACDLVFSRSEAGVKRETVNTDPYMQEPLACCPKCGSLDYKKVRG